MTTSLKPPLKGHWPIAFALGGTPAEPALVPLNYTLNVLAGDEYRVPIALPHDPAVAALVEERMDGDGRFRVGPAVGLDGVVAVLSIPDFADRPAIVLDEESRALASLSPSARPSITLKELRDAASAVIPERDPSERAPEPSGNALSVARDIGFCAYWAIGDRITTARRRQAMTEAGWPEDLVTWATSGNASSLASASATA